MPKTIKLESFVMNNAELTEKEPVTSDPTGRVLRNFEVTTTLFNQLSLDTYNEVLSKKRIHLQVPDHEIDLMVNVGTYTSSYKGNIGESPINVRVELSEIDPDLPEVHSIEGATAVEAIMSRLTTRTLISLLIDSGHFTKEQFDTRYNEISQKEQETKELFNALIYGYHKNPEK